MQRGCTPTVAEARARSSSALVHAVATGAHDDLARPDLEDQVLAELEAAARTRPRYSQSRGFEGLETRRCVVPAQMLEAQPQQSSLERGRQTSPDRFVNSHASGLQPRAVPPDHRGMRSKLGLVFPGDLPKPTQTLDDRGVVGREQWQ